jgi:hypothetical protein
MEQPLLFFSFSNFVNVLSLSLTPQISPGEKSGRRRMLPWLAPLMLRRDWIQFVNLGSHETTMMMEK